MSKKGFKELLVWQKAKDIAITVYKLTLQRKLPKCIQYIVV